MCVPPRRGEIDIAEHAPVIADEPIRFGIGNPDTSVGSFADAPCARLIQAGDASIRPDAHHLSSGAKPHGAAMTLLPEKLEYRCSAMSRVRLQSGSDEPRHAPRRVDPHGAVAILTDGADEVARQTVALGVGHCNAVAKARQASVDGADPQVSGPALGHVQNASAAEPTAVCRAENGEALAIEARQPTERPDPEIALWVLQHGVDGVLRQALFRLPDFGDVLRRW